MCAAANFVKVRNAYTPSTSWPRGSVTTALLDNSSMLALTYTLSLVSLQGANHWEEYWWHIRILLAWHCERTVCLERPTGSLDSTSMLAVVASPAIYKQWYISNRKAHLVLSNFSARVCNFRWLFMTAAPCCVSDISPNMQHETELWV